MNCFWELRAGQLSSEVRTLYVGSVPSLRLVYAGEKRVKNPRASQTHFSESRSGPAPGLTVALHKQRGAALSLRARAVVVNSRPAPACWAGALTQSPVLSMVPNLVSVPQAFHHRVTVSQMKVLGVFPKFLSTILVKVASHGLS